MEIRKFDAPFPYIIVDGFIKQNYCDELVYAVEEARGKWVHYSNDFEKKRALNEFERGGKLWKLFHYFQSGYFIKQIQDIVGLNHLIPDPQLHGSGIHVTDPGGYLGRHVDYAIHPKFYKERRLNLILFLSNWNQGDGGELELYDNKELFSLIDPIPGRMILWEPTECQGEPLRFHGTRENTGCTSRITACVYYLSELRPGTPSRYEALFAPNRSVVHAM